MQKSPPRVVLFLAEDSSRDNRFSFTLERRSQHVLDNLTPRGFTEVVTSLIFVGFISNPGVHMCLLRHLKYLLLPAPQTVSTVSSLQWTDMMCAMSRWLRSLLSIL